MTEIIDRTIASDVKLKSIQLVRYISDNENGNAQTSPSNFKTVELISRECDNNIAYDIILATSTVTGEKRLYLGHWNDGVL